MIRKLALIALLLAWLAVCPPAWSQTAPAVRAHWSPPTTGLPAVGYELEVTADGELWALIETDEPQYTFVEGVLQMLVSYRARVRAFDVQGRRGPWSEFNEPYVYDPGAPGGCGLPGWLEL